MWVKHPTRRNIARYHLNCRGEEALHDYEASVIIRPDHDSISLHLPAKTVKEDTTLEFISMVKLNRFLRLIKLETIRL